MPSLPRAGISVTAKPVSRRRSARTTPRLGLKICNWMWPIASRSSIHMPTTLPVAKPAAYPRILSGLSRLESTLVMAMMYTTDWKNPNSQEMPLRPRTTNNRRRVSSDISTTRRPKMLAAAIQAEGVRRNSNMVYSLFWFHQPL